MKMLLTTTNLSKPIEIPFILLLLHNKTGNQTFLPIKTELMEGF